MEAEISGVLIVDKPEGLTSHDVVARARKILNTRRIGHFGTLDPFATGVLPLSIGKATRFAQFYLKSRKAYVGMLRFGFSTDTYDVTGTPSPEPHCAPPDRAALESAMREFTGRIRQTPPPFSAKRVGGVRAYQLARRCEEVKLEPVEIEIYALEILAVSQGGEEVRFAVECSGGTYVRSLAHDLGTRLGCPAHLASLRRTAVAEFHEDRAVTLERLQELAAAGSVLTAITPLDALLPDCPALVVTGHEEKSIRYGRAFELAHSLRSDRGLQPGCAPAMPILKILNRDRHLLAIARRVSGSVYHPDLVLV